MHVEEIAKELSLTQLLAVGESTHGTHEFFITKTKLFIELVQYYGFNTFMLEDGQDKCEQINQYIQTGNGHIKTLVGNLYSVWRVKELAILIEWLKNNFSKYPVSFVGFDIKQSKDNVNKRDELMAQNIIAYVTKNPKSRCMIWSHNRHIKKSAEASNSKPMGTFLQKEFGKDYLAIGQFFGTGEFNATPIDESKPHSFDRSLRTIQVSKIYKELLEYKLQVYKQESYYLPKEEFKNLGINKSFFARSLGWGLVPSRINEYVERCNPDDEYDGLIYHPTSSCSQSI